MGTNARSVSASDVETGAGEHMQLGRAGEDLAAMHLAKSGLVVLSRNWRCREGELDLVATDGKTLVVCEVKTRSVGALCDPAEAVTAEKVTRIRRLATRWLSAYHVGWCPIRFDVIAIEGDPSCSPRVRHIKGAF